MKLSEIYTTTHIRAFLLKLFALQDVVNDRLNHCLSHVAGDADECAACAGTNKCRLYGYAMI